MKQTVMKGVEHPYVETRESHIHGTGAYARKVIPKGKRFIEYVGPRITKAQSLVECETGNEYIFTVDDETDIDGKVWWNIARFINHSCQPNCEAELDGNRVFILALRKIHPGEELTYNYGYDIEDWEDHVCRCGTKDCVGYMVAAEFFETVRRKLAVRHDSRRELVMA